MMSRRRRKPATFSAARHDQYGARQTQSVKRRLRRPTKGYTAKRQRTAVSGSQRRLRGEPHGHDAELELRSAELEGLAGIDEIVLVRACVGARASCAPEVDVERQAAVVEGLLGKRLPALELQWMPGEWLDIRALGSKPLVLYCQPGLDEGAFLGGRGADDRTIEADAAESRAFAERGLELAAMSHRVVGVSAQGSVRQLEMATQEALPHVMLSDERLELAEEMDLPTVEIDGVRVYERLTLVVWDGRVEKVFYPIADPAAHAAEVVEWLHGRIGGSAAHAAEVLEQLRER